MSEVLYPGVIFKEHPILLPNEIKTEDDRDYAITEEDDLIKNRFLSKISKIFQ